MWLEKSKIKKKRTKIGYRKIQINGEWFIWDEREGEKKRRRTGEKRYKEKGNKTVEGQRKRKLEKNHKKESRYRKSTHQGTEREKKKGRDARGIKTWVEFGDERKGRRRMRRKKNSYRQ
jgi:hypothetical protein